MNQSSDADSVLRPDTVEDLRTLTLGIRRGEVDVSLGGKALEVLSRLVDTPEQAAVRTITELAEGLGVNPSTLTRLSKRLGFTGFSEFQAVFRKAIASDQTYFYSRQANRLITAKQEAGEEIGIVEKLAAESKSNIDGFLAQLDADALRGAAELLAHSKRIRVHGVRQFHSFASFLVYGLGMLRSDVSLLDSTRLGEAERLAQLEAGDVVVVASCTPYTRNVADVAAAAGKLGMNVIAVTDTRSSPLTPWAKHTFLIPHFSSFFSNSMGAYIVFCEGLLNLVARELGDSAVAALAAREKLIGAMGVEIE
ncbi:MurR/RpiR family transcriptional regulator [Ensifer sp. ENS04]|uniref:MurR/RpiR family transcriptional regulator n=1 Tax=Ensifer sp. ENS04 TaxID=2769281 RepID=UPI001784D3A1|nr:MurR/RpiR family transcriptional regulator [Ensifer sp. ENS04]MBD9541358.1 MurR/RpiR family transcriptional regulator [Ensifer sp. ENS04]